MGLDMYLHATATCTHSRYDGGVRLYYEGPFQRFEKLQYERNFLDLETNCQIGYWRKFNALHRYIVDNFADGEDECQRIRLSRSDIAQILELLKKITRENAMELLPPSQGFFFGSQEIDDWYMSDVEYGIKVFQLALEFLDEEMRSTKENPSADDWEINKDNPFKDYEYREIYYQASW